MTHYSNLECSKRLQPILEKLGVRCDGWYSGGTISDNPYHKVYVDGVEPTPLYRSDTLEDLLPRTFIEKGRVCFNHMSGIDMKTWERIVILLRAAAGTRNPEKLTALTDLICLLDKEGLL